MGEKIKFDYGKKGLKIALEPEWDTTILNPTVQKALINPIKEIKQAIKNPLEGESLHNIVKSRSEIQQICIVVSDATRPVPSRIILQALMEELNECGIKDDQIVVIIATGLHRSSREEELTRILGKKLKKRLNIINHVANDKSSLKYLGVTKEKIPIFLNKYYCESDLKIITGYVEPHFFFGFAGGRKSIVPGIAGEETIQANHSAENISSPYSRFGIYKENPMHKNSIEITEMIGVDFAVNVCINEHHQIVKVAAGNYKRVHENLVNYQLDHIFKEIKEPYDIVICGNGGYPLDLNLYQGVKSMAIGEMAVKKGGTIISVNECSDGIGHEHFKELICAGMNPRILYNKILKGEIVVPDQWEIQILARILMNTEIVIVSELQENEIGNIGLKYARTVEDGIKVALEKHGLNASILILPNGPQVLPILK
ncbi:MAG: nickel-dependent lactate racemase [Promethearchaeota archaeon]